MLFEFIIPKRPVSLQTRNRKHLQEWKNYVHLEASRKWDGELERQNKLRLTIIYLCDNNPADVDNIIKPIQDALVGKVYIDDSIIIDVESHKRPFSGTFEINSFPDVFLEGILLNSECVYVRISDSKELEKLINE